MPEPRNRNIFLAIFGLLFAIAVGFVIWRGPREDAEGWVDQVLSLWGELAPLAAVAIVGAAFLTEIVRWIMVIAGWLEEKLERTREARRAEGRAEGIEQGIERGIEQGIARGIAQGRTEGITEGRAEGRTEGIAEADRDWDDWLQRRESALDRGEPFAEPPPSRFRNGARR